VSPRPSPAPSGSATPPGAPDGGAGRPIGHRDVAGRGRRRRRPSGDDRERDILATAERLLDERPLRDISVDDLARGAGISRPTFYFYFASKEAVLLTLLDRIAEEARARRDEALGDMTDEPARLWRRALEAIHHTFGSHRGLTLATAQLLATSGEAQALWGRILEGFVAETALAIEAERDRGAAPPGPPARDLAVALNWMNERVLFSAFAAQPPAIDEVDALDVLLTVWLRAIYGAEGPP
jgi:AcrR family transcriptional regulator